MTRIADLLAAGPTWSFEFFPPKTPEGAAALDGAIDELATLGCEVPVIPGVMPFVSVPGTRRMAGINNTEIPDWLNERLDAVDGDAEATRQLGVEVATDLVAELLDYGVPGVHLYAMNRATSIKEIYGKLGLLG